MAALVDLWCALTPRTRVFCWTGWTILLSALAAWCLFSSAETDSESLNRLRMENRQLWSALYRLAGTEEERLSAEASPDAPFSPFAISLPGLQLRRWQPSAQGGELALHGNWEAVPSLFVYLAERGVSVNGFSLTMEKNELLMTLALESLHE